MSPHDGLQFIRSQCKYNIGAFHVDARRCCLLDLHIVCLRDRDHAAPVFLPRECFHMSDQAAVFFDFGGRFAHSLLQRVHGFFIAAGYNAAHGSDHSLLVRRHLQRRDAVVVMVIMVMMLVLMMMIVLMVVMLMVMIVFMMMIVFMVVMFVMRMVVVSAFTFFFFSVLYSEVIHDNNPPQ